ncbi:hypothetical protein [Candidatus Neptunochlamydia vexilliferae]|uniref:PH domain-containing protein n=1 Tax=Candidatus Neptunichlamydia vexilliferae TaxID=1651774 RepID=A0ABS0AXW8_9BACT|nr:hypothetical protein [Candidatus Neptunochlamydia vexilliferae]MBF5058815.1 hypothetical protein [Candidatus Neptunochlamydia vexilliferae]
MSITTNANHVSTYEYIYEAGSCPNRKVEFYIEKNKHEIFAQITPKSMGKWQNTIISEIKESQMIKEGASTSQSKKFNQLELKEKLEVLQNLDPKGAWCIHFKNNIGENPFFEKAKQLIFFDPHA